jgi:hypothetical protein
LTVAIHKKVRRNSNQTADAAEPVFSYPATPQLQALIVEIWSNGNFTSPPPGGGPAKNYGPLKDALLKRNAKGNPTGDAYDVAKLKINVALGIDLVRPVVISEAEHDNDYFKDDDEVVFVLPDEGRVVIPSPIPVPPVPPAPPSAAYTKLLEAAKLLMACTPNGI